MLKKILLIVHTIRFLKVKQLFFQVWYRLKRTKTLSAYDSSFNQERLVNLSFTLQPPNYKSVLNERENCFYFLNIEKRFGNRICWNEQKNGKLWNYNLQYGNYLLQEGIAYSTKRKWVLELYHWLSDGKLQLEPYPASLRSINVIRMLITYDQFDFDILSYLHAELSFLSNRLEFHLLGNHLLENLFALLMGSVYFDEQKWHEKAQRLLIQQLNEQILSDGAHFELSPMYHNIILFRILELIDWYSKWKKKDLQFELNLRETASMMLSWINNIQFSDGGIPHFNDSTNNIAYSTNWLLNYGAKLSIKPIDSLPLGESGYRSFSFGNYECKVDVAAVGASYQPGHAHADSLSFILNFNGKPFLVEQGTSTYSPGQKRCEERGTAAHNTVVINNKNQSEVWSSFRVGKRAKVLILKESNCFLDAQHDGYQAMGYLHRRVFKFYKEKIVIRDYIINDQNKDELGVAYFHIHPSFDKEHISNMLRFMNFIKIDIDSYEFAEGFNQYLNGNCYKIEFKNFLETEIILPSFN